MLATLNLIVIVIMIIDHIMVNLKFHNYELQLLRTNSSIGSCNLI